MTKSIPILAATLWLFLSPLVAMGGDVVLGVVGLPDDAGCPAFAVWVPLTEGQATEGVAWYNNDGGTPFMNVSAVAGEITDPEDVAAATQLSEQVYGVTGGWSEAWFTQPVGSETAGLYLIFEVGAGDGFSHEGAGGGAGLGYEEGDGVITSWFTGDGETWHAMKETARFAVHPVMSAGKSGAVLVLGRVTEQNEATENALPEATLSIEAYPNPFNPRVSLAFSLERTANVSVSAYDLRGRLVRRIVSSEMPAGDHVVVWDGQNEAGAAVPSGTYYVRVDDGWRSTASRVTMIK